MLNIKNLSTIKYLSQFHIGCQANMDGSSGVIWTMVAPCSCLMCLIVPACFIVYWPIISDAFHKPFIINFSVLLRIFCLHWRHILSERFQQQQQFQKSQFWLAPANHTTPPTKECRRQPQAKHPHSWFIYRRYRETAVRAGESWARSTFSRLLR